MFVLHGFPVPKLDGINNLIQSMVQFSAPLKSANHPANGWYAKMFYRFVLETRCHAMKKKE
jgi:hypothetical protein